MDRDEMRRLLAAERAGAIAPEDEARLQAALAADPELAREERAERALDAWISADREALRRTMPTDLAARVLEGVRRREAAPLRGAFGVRRTPAFLRPAAAAAALLVLVAAGFWAGRTTTRAEVSHPGSDLAEKIRGTAEREGLDPAAAERLLETFEAEKARIEAEHRAALGRAIAELEAGMQRLAGR